MENNNGARGDIFTLAWEDEAGGIVADSREDEELPPEGAQPSEDPEAAAESAGEGSGENPRTDDAGAPVTALPAGEPPIVGRGEPLTPEVRDREIRQFLREYPDVTAEDIPRSVWRRVAAGESLITAYSRHEAAALRRENELLAGRLAARERARENRERSAGSQLGTGAGRALRDPFDDGWELEW